MMLKEYLDNLVVEYEGLLNAGQKKNYMPIIKKAFVPYLLSEFSKENHDVDYLLGSVLTTEHIIKGGMYYVDNTKKVTDIAAVRKYLSVVGEMCRKIIFKKYPTSTLKSIDDFQSLCDRIVERSKKDLGERKSHAHLSVEDYAKLDAYLSEVMNDSSYKQQVIIAVFRLILLYGFKIGMISGAKKEDYDGKKNTLKIYTENRMDHFLIELPYLLSRQIEKVSISNAIDSEYLFLTESGQLIYSDYFDYALVNISREIKATSKITTTALSKYAVINMFLEGINPIIISKITGMKDVNLRYCQQIAYDMTRLDSNRYINSKIRNIHTFDDCNF